jgi:hypothetical protein
LPFFLSFPPGICFFFVLALALAFVLALAFAFALALALAFVFVFAFAFAFLAVVPQGSASAFALAFLSVIPSGNLLLSLSATTKPVISVEAHPLALTKTSSSRPKHHALVLVMRSGETPVFLAFAVACSSLQTLNLSDSL